MPYQEVQYINRKFFWKQMLLLLSVIILLSLAIGKGQFYIPILLVLVPILAIAYIPQYYLRLTVTITDIGISYQVKGFTGFFRKHLLSSFPFYFKNDTNTVQKGLIQRNNIQQVEVLKIRLLVNTTLFHKGISLKRIHENTLNYMFNGKHYMKVYTTNSMDYIFSVGDEAAVRQALQELNYPLA